MLTVGFCAGLALLSSGHWALKGAMAAIGMLAVGAPMLFFNAWLKSQGADEAPVAASWIAASVDRQIGQTAAALQDLASRGIGSCRAADVEAMRRSVLASGWTKEIELISPAGRVLCTDAGSQVIGQRHALSATTHAESGLILEAVRVTDLGDRFLRIRLAPHGGNPSLGALIPVAGVLPHATLHGGRLLTYARLTLPDGTTIGNSGVAPEADTGFASETITRATSQYGILVSVSMLGNSVFANREDLRRIGMVVSGVVALLILGTALLFRLRRGDSPVADVARAMLAEEFVPYYQPVVDIQSGKLLGAEVLVRWRQPDGTLILPGAFIPLLESSGLIVDLTRLLMRQVSRDMGEAFGARPNLSIAFNVAPQHFVDGLILNDVGSLFNGSPIRLSQIVLELTERYEVRDLAATRGVIAALQGLGCRVAIDDVGAGHSGLSYILKLGVDIIKIDKIFVEAIGTEAHSRAIIETMIDLARNMRMEVIAEGVETFEQVAYLREHGIQSAQGFVFAPPLPASSFLKLMEAMEPAQPQNAKTAPAREPGRMSRLRLRGRGDARTVTAR
jgi:sensor c-di-GMP phosphodiesterase-like protein